MKTPMQLAEQFKVALTEYQTIVGTVGFEKGLDKVTFQTEVLKHLTKHFVAMVEALDAEAA